VTTGLYSIGNKTISGMDVVEDCVTDENLGPMIAVICVVIFLYVCLILCPLFRPVWCCTHWAWNRLERSREKYANRNSINSKSELTV